MDKTKPYITQETQTLVVPLLLVLIFIPYSNTLTSSWHLDDVINILWNTPLHPDSLSFSDLCKTLFAYPTHPGRLYRPISCITLAINWYFGQDDTIGYHIVNIAIHALTTLILYKTILLLLNSPRLKEKYQGYEQSISVLATIFWAVNPIQTQAITYIVQRMASMAALFYLLGIYFYIRSRFTKTNLKKKILCILFMTFCFLFALGSKENSIMFPFSILLIEIIFFNNLITTKRNVIILIFTFATIFGFAAFLSNSIHISSLFTSYQNRNFTLLQRLLTEPRVICWYLSLLFYPSVTRLSIEHDIQLSTSLFTPATTLPSIFFLIGLCIFAIWGYKKYPISAFAILFFLLNHLVESTILPLELVFEHRNYLPSLFLFLPIAIFAVQLINGYQQQKVMHSILIVFLGLIMSSLGMGTYIRNQEWLTEKSLWTDAAIKAPDSMRAFLNLAYTYEYEGDLQTAFRLNQLALKKASPTHNKFTLIAYTNMGNIMRKMGRYQDAIAWYNEGLKINESSQDILFNKFLTQQASGEQTEAKQTLLFLLKLAPQNSRYILDYGNIEIMEGTPEPGMQTLRKALLVSSGSEPSAWQSLLSLALASNRMHQFDKALFYIHFAHNQGAPDFLVGLCTLENHILRGNQNPPDHLIKVILSSAPLTEIRKKIVFGLDNAAKIALDKKLILGYIESWLQNQAATTTQQTPAAP